jgi:cell wall-associated NlpC family hydrolase
MPWTDDYIGLPFKCDGRDRSGLDCWGLVRLVYAERLGINLPAKAGIFTDWEPETLRRVAAAMEEEAARWQRVDEPMEYDVVLMRRGELELHVGLWVPRRDLLHISAGINSTREPINGLRRRHSIVGFYRHAQ